MKEQRIEYDLDPIDRHTDLSFSKSIKKALWFISLLIVFLLLQVLSISIVHALQYPAHNTGQLDYAGVHKNICIG